VAWVDAGPANTAWGGVRGDVEWGTAARPVGGHVCPRGRVTRSVSDVGFDGRGGAVLRDWLQIVHAQLPDALYPPPTRGGVV
jgi:hypothetical protein